jgi:uncharacterized membrane protein
MATALWAIGLVILGTIVGAGGPIFLKKAAGNIKLTIRGLATNLNLILGIGSYALGTIVFIPALKGGELSVLYPFVALAYVWVSLLSVKFLKEKMTLKKWAGVALIILGVAFKGIVS